MRCFCWLMLLTAAQQRDDTSGVFYDYLFWGVIAVTAGVVYSRLRNDHQKKEPKKPTLEEKRETLRKIAGSYRGSTFIDVLAKEIRRHEDEHTVSSITLKQTGMVIRYDAANARTVSYQSLGYSALSEENRIPAACALVLKLGAYQNYDPVLDEKQQPTASLRASTDQTLKDPNLGQKP